jgi:hypothetical protein
MTFFPASMLPNPLAIAIRLLGQSPEKAVGVIGMQTLNPD